ncbi:MAG: class I tRNA ligase family protein, partial [Planctomycetaceae bacterium]
MFQKVDEARFIEGEHEMLRLWQERDVFRQLMKMNAGGPKWSFLDGPITANNPMGVHHAWGRTYKDAYQRYFAMTGHELRYQNGFDCQGLWVEVEVEKELGLGTKTAIVEQGIDTFVRECKQRVLRFAARQTEQSIRLGYWMEWDDPDELRKLADAIGLAAHFTCAPSDKPSTSNQQPSTTYVTARGQQVTGDPEDITARLGNPAWGGSYYTFSTENNETIWTFLKKCFERGKIYLGHDVMPWGGRAGSAYSQMEVADGRRLTTHRSCFVRFPIVEKGGERRAESGEPGNSESLNPQPSTLNELGGERRAESREPGESASLNSQLSTLNEYLLVWTTTPWTLTSNVACAVNPDLEYVRVKAQLRGDEEPAYYYFAKDNLDYKRLEREYKEGFGRPEWQWPAGLGKLKTIAQIFKEQGGYEIEAALKGADMIGWRYEGPFDDLEAQHEPGGVPTPQPIDERVHPVTDMIRGLHNQWNNFLTNNGNYVDRPSLMQAVEDVCGAAVRRHWLGKNPFSDRRLPDGWSGFPVADELQHWILSLLPSNRLKNLAYEVSEAESHLFHVQVVNQNWGGPDEADLEKEHETRKRLSNWNSVQAGQEFTSREFLQELADNEVRFLEALRDELKAGSRRIAIEAHCVISGGRDSKGNPNVSAGEGTGIVHIAPGCGDIDHVLGEAHQKPIIAPLKEDGSFGDGFGPFTGRKAVDPETADLVFEELKRKGLLVYVETYPHIYPHCWRTGEELVFRLVDEWFINMDWREEIKEVTRCIEWLPEAIQGQEREVEWLSTMRDWMISKKRFWGLALPIWVNPDDATDFKVVGDLDELKRLATDGGEGWDEFEGHTPHRPWIDAVKIPSDKHPGQLLTRVEDVGNPWLDAGITPFSTLNYNEWKRQQGPGVRSQESGVRGQGSGVNQTTNIQHPTSTQCSTLNAQRSTLNWTDWYPADFVVESFPGQFRNWFYSLLALSTMMRYDETDDPREKRPFKSLLGHRLVMDETGKPMHKSDGSAIWFEEAADQLGVDTLRWMYLAQNPAADLRFGTRHPDQPVALYTPDGPITETKEGLPTCKVTSKPADEIRRQVLIPLWNSYAFFINYAVADEFDPTLPLVELQTRPEIDRWILSRLQELTGTARDSFEAFDVARFMDAAVKFIDDLSNWYIRRNRRRFWRSRSESTRESTPAAQSSRGAAWDADKLAAYQTLYDVLVTLTKLLAPCVPFLCERMYQNLVVSCQLSGVSGKPSAISGQ